MALLKFTDILVLTLCSEYCAVLAQSSIFTTSLYDFVGKGLTHLIEQHHQKPFLEFLAEELRT